MIIDASEYLIEKRTYPRAQKATWSDYKHNNTLKLRVFKNIVWAGTFLTVQQN